MLLFLDLFQSHKKSTLFDKYWERQISKQPKRKICKNPTGIGFFRLVLAIWKWVLNRSLYVEMADIEGLQAAAGSRFSQVELIGRGSFGDVYKAFDKELNKEVAIKVIDLEESKFLFCHNAAVHTSQSIMVPIFTKPNCG
ncbi:hypothetical protein V6N13_136696 [Hibiscus sabdariffa]